MFLQTSVLKVHSLFGLLVLCLQFYRDTSSSPRTGETLLGLVILKVPFQITLCSFLTSSISLCTGADADCRVLNYRVAVKTEWRCPAKYEAQLRHGPYMSDADPNPRIPRIDRFPTLQINDCHFRNGSNSLECVHIVRSRRAKTGPQHHSLTGQHPLAAARSKLRDRRADSAFLARARANVDGI